MYCCFHPLAPGPVSKLEYEEKPDTSVKIIWEPPKETNGPVVAYNVKYGVYPNESIRSVTIDARKPSHTVIQALGKLLLLHILPTFLGSAFPSYIRINCRSSLNRP